MNLFVLDTDMSPEDWTNTLRRVEIAASKLVEKGVDPWDYRKTYWPYGVPVI